MTTFHNVEQSLEWAARLLRDLAFVGPDPNYAIGLDALVPGLVVAVADDSPGLDGLRSSGVECLAVDGPAMEGRSALTVLQHPRTLALFEKRSIGKLLVFKSSHALETAAAHAGLELIAASSAVARRWENKAAFVEIGKRLGLNLPPTAKVDLTQASYRSLVETLGPYLVIQAPHGYAGARTFHVHDEASFGHAREEIRSPIARVAGYVEGRPMTLNACVTAKGIAIGRPFEQLTGIGAFTPYRLGSCGQIWSKTYAGDSAREEMIGAARTIGEALALDGFRGVFGVDFVKPSSGLPYVIEVNARLIASIAAFTQLEILAGRVPLLMRHIAAFVEPEADHVSLDEHLGPLDGAQVVIHNVRDEQSPIPGEMSGVWRQSDGAWRRVQSAAAAIRISRLGPSEAIVLSGPPGRQVAPGAEWARVQRGPLLAADSDPSAYASRDPANDIRAVVAQPLRGRDDREDQSLGRRDGDPLHDEPIIALAELVAARLGGTSA